MAKWKEPTTQVAVTGVDPRARMKEIRAMVASHMKGGPVNEDLGYLAHLGDLPDNMDDARRVIIALQDLLDITNVKHRKATAHICELVDILEGMSQNELDAMAMIGQRDRQIHELQQLNGHHEQEIVATRREVQHMRQQRDAVLTTMKLERDMATPAPTPGIMPRETFGERQATPQVNRGPVTLEQLLRNMAMGRAR